MTSGLSVVGRRAEALGRFMTGYARLARLPAPNFAPLDVGEWVQRVVKLQSGPPIEVQGGSDVRIAGDADQLDQLLINLVKNAVEASAETGGGVRVCWKVDESTVEIVVEDDGPGVSDTSNLFVPFFTTKPGGSGIGLALARQIAEGHAGRVVLRKRSDARRGAQAVVRLPIRQHERNPASRRA